MICEKNSLLRIVLEQRRISLTLDTEFISLQTFNLSINVHFITIVVSFTLRALRRDRPVRPNSAVQFFAENILIQKSGVGIHSQYGDHRQNVRAIRFCSGVSQGKDGAKPSSVAQSCRILLSGRGKALRSHVC